MHNLSRRLYLFVFISLILVGLSQASSSDVFKKGEQSTLEYALYNSDLTPCTLCTCEVSIFQKNGASLVRNDAGTNVGGYCQYNYTFEDIGNHGVDISFTNGADSGFMNFIVEVTVSGSDAINGGEGNIALGSIFIILLICLILFYMYNKTTNKTLRIFFLVGFLVTLLLTIMYSTVLIQQTLGNYSLIVNGYEVFYQIITYFAYIMLLILLIFGILIAIQYHKWKRGLLD